MTLRSFVLWAAVVCAGCGSKMDRSTARASEGLADPELELGTPHLMPLGVEPRANPTLARNHSNPIKGTESVEF